MTHTKGSWLRDKRTVYALNEDGVNRFHLYVGGGFNDNHDRTSDEELEANAKFIVKACNCHDDLLEALEAALKLTNEFIDEHISSDRNKFQNPIAVKAIRAIAKAKGETP